MFISKCRFQFLRSPNGLLNVRLNAAKTGSWGNCIIYIFNNIFYFSKSFLVVVICCKKHLN